MDVLGSGAGAAVAAAAAAALAVAAARLDLGCRRGIPRVRRLRIRLARPPRWRDCCTTTCCRLSGATEAVVTAEAIRVAVALVEVEEEAAAGAVAQGRHRRTIRRLRAYASGIERAALVRKRPEKERDGGAGGRWRGETGKEMGRGQKRQVVSFAAGGHIQLAWSAAMLQLWEPPSLLTR